MKFLFHPKAIFLVRMLVGAVFIVAAVPKIADPPSFAHMIYNYRLVPGPLINLMALVMPWLELFCGIALIAGRWKQSATILITTMLVLFVAALTINLIRDHAVDCGCFEVYAVVKSRQQLLSEMKSAILRDLGLLVLCAQLLFAGSPPHERMLSAQT